MIKCNNCGNVSDYQQKKCFHCGKPVQHSTTVGLLKMMVVFGLICFILVVATTWFKGTSYYKEAQENALRASIPAMQSDDYEGRYNAYIELYRLTNKREYIESSKLYKELMVKEWASNGVQVGMSKDRVLLSKWGAPQKINRSINKSGAHEQWIYGNGKYLYFDDNKLVAIQD